MEARKVTPIEKIRNWWNDGIRSDVRKDAISGIIGLCISLIPILVKRLVMKNAGLMDLKDQLLLGMELSYPMISVAMALTLSAYLDKKQTKNQEARRRISKFWILMVVELVVALMVCISNTQFQEIGYTFLEINELKVLNITTSVYGFVISCLVVVYRAYAERMW